MNCIRENESWHNGLTEVEAYGKNAVSKVGQDFPVGGIVREYFWQHQMYKGRYKE